MATVPLLRPLSLADAAALCAEDAGFQDKDEALVRAFAESRLVLGRADRPLKYLLPVVHLGSLTPEVRTRLAEARRRYPVPKDDKLAAVLLGGEPRTVTSAKDLYSDAGDRFGRVLASRLYWRARATAPALEQADAQAIVDLALGITGHAFGGAFYEPYLHKEDHCLAAAAAIATRYRRYLVGLFHFPLQLRGLSKATEKASLVWLDKDSFNGWRLDPEGHALYAQTVAAPAKPRRELDVYTQAPPPSRTALMNRDSAVDELWRDESRKERRAFKAGLSGRYRPPPRSVPPAGWEVCAAVAFHLGVRDGHSSSDDDDYV